jgi:hypothetical protein
MVPVLLTSDLVRLIRTSIRKSDGWSHQSRDLTPPALTGSREHFVGPAFRARISGTFEDFLLGLNSDTSRRSASDFALLTLRVPALQGSIGTLDEVTDLPGLVRICYQPRAGPAPKPCFSLIAGSSMYFAG